MLLRRSLVLCFLVAAQSVGHSRLCADGYGVASDVSSQQPVDEAPVVKLALPPAAPPVAALKYPLLPSYLDQTEGNAATLYYRAIIFLNRRGDASQKKIADWEQLPLQELRREEVRKGLADFRGVLEELHAAARCDHCRWEIPIRHARDIFSISLEEVQQSRGLARVLSVEARLYMLDGKFDDAVRTLQTGYALARHVAQTPFLISGLVGMSISNIMCDRVQELVQFPGAPNLYWSLTKLPRPFIDMGPAMDLESVTVYMMFPFLKDAETADRTPAQWQAELEDFHKRLSEAVALEGSADSLPPRWVMAARAVQGYPTAKQHLLSKGYAADRIEKMPVAQVLAIYTADTFDVLRDETFKWFYVPYWQGRQGIARAELASQPKGRFGKEIIPLASLLLPAISNVNLAAARNERRFAELRLIEGLCLYAAAHDGKLPVTLADITEVPLPIDPITGKEFDYHMEGPIATINVGSPPGLMRRHFGKRYEVTIRKP